MIVSLSTFFWSIDEILFEFLKSLWARTIAPIIATKSKNPEDYDVFDKQSLAKYTTDTGKILFLKLKDSIATTATGNTANGATSQNNVLEINGTNVTFSTGTSIANAVTDINSTASTLVTASEAAVPTTVTSVTSDYSYGLLGGYTPFSGNITSGSGTFLANVTSSPSGNASE